MESGKQRFRYFGSFNIFLVFFAIFCLALPRKSEAGPAMPQEWQSDKQQFRAPEIEMRLLKGRVNPEENLGFHTEYIYSPKDFESQVSLVKEEATGTGYNHDSQWSSKYLPIDIRTVVVVPSMKCPEGQGRAHDGSCRKVVFMKRP